MRDHKISEKLSYFDSNHDHLEELFTVLNRDQQWADSAEGIHAYVQSGWVGFEHGATSEKDQFELKEITAARTVLSEMGLLDEIPLNGIVAEQNVIVAGLMRVNLRLMAFTRKHLDVGNLDTPEIVIWAGQRPRNLADDIFVNTLDLDNLGKKNDWARDQNRIKINHPKAFLPTETDLVKLALINSFDDVKLEEEIKSPNGPKVGEPVLTRYSVEGYPYFTVMDSAAVARRGISRSTTSSCAYDWVQTFDLPLNSTVALSIGNPHLPRVLRDVQAGSQSADRGDIQFKAAGPEAHPDPVKSFYHCLGEIGRLIHQDIIAA